MREYTVRNCYVTTTKVIYKFVRFYSITYLNICIDLRVVCSKLCLKEIANS